MGCRGLGLGKALVHAPGRLAECFAHTGMSGEALVASHGARVACTPGGDEG
jgi:hypothetical protein